MFVTLAANAQSGGHTDPDHIDELLTRAGARVERVALADLDGSLPTGTERVVVAGGDGSIGTAARAANRTGVPLAVVPTGTANDFARTLALPTDLDQACALAADPLARTSHREVGTIGTHPFVNAAAAGLSAVASRHAKPHKAMLGPLAYALGAVRAGLTAPALDCQVRCDGAECFSGRVWQVVVGVTGAFGGGSRIGGTRHDDGELDVAVVPAGPRLTLVRRAIGMRRGRLTTQQDVPHYRGSVVEVELPADAAFNIDGELQAWPSARFALLPGGVEVVVP